MNVVSIQRRQRKIFLGEYSSLGKEAVPDDVKFLAGAVSTLLLPTLVFCIAIGQFLPFYLMALNDAAGVVLGVVMFKKSSKGFLSCIPNVQMDARVVKQRKAA